MQETNPPPPTPLGLTDPTVPCTTTSSSSSSSSSATTTSATTSRRPRAQSLQHFGDKCAVPRECCSSGSFVSKLYRMVDSEPSTIVAWCRGGSAFCIVDPKLMAEHCLPKYFRHRRFSSLIRQLNFYSFYRVQEGQLTIYQHSFFRKGRADLLVHIKRRGAGKAKDPWFDPLAAAAAATASTKVAAAEYPLATATSGALTPTMPSTSLGFVACYSPMAKSVALDNMSPALKPAMVQLCPPSVELGSPDVTDGLLKKDGDPAYPLLSALSPKSELLFSDMMDSNVSLHKTPSALAAAPLAMDIPDFLTDDCNITPGQSDDRLCSSGAHSNKCAMVSRDCLKLDDVEHTAPAPVLARQEGEPEPASFDNEVFLDFASVEPGAWEVPLSPLNDEEDVMPWLDLCF
ncbi:unnamed protein product [Hyaloperonospora brassicae]|uniref:HSF-type DNA-binding domain-containing protein n=1 Tax=Hyaloperonospora brassicae TaxID=162125 RepID=A0AAV0TCA9_HYABA|nr:unnamed protein product [Hyaloperonospora brassicae]